jgi:hypothetical protein
MFNALSPHPTRAEIDAWYLATCQWKVAERRYFDRQHELMASLGCLPTDTTQTARLVAILAISGNFADAASVMEWTTPEAVAAELAAITDEASEIARRP